MENTLKKYKLENLNPFSGSTYKPLADNDETFSVISSSCPRMIPDGFTDIDKSLDGWMETESSIAIPQNESNNNRSLPKADDCYAKTSKWLDCHEVDTQTNRLGPQKDRNNAEPARSISDPDSTESDLESLCEKDSTERPKSSASNRRKSRHEYTANKHKTEMVNRTLPTENSSDEHSELDKHDRGLVSLLNRVPDDGDSLAPSHSVTCLAESTSNQLKSRKGQPRVLQQQNNSDHQVESQSSVWSEGFDNDSIAPLVKNKRKITPAERQKTFPSSSQIRYKSVLPINRPDKRKSETLLRSPQKRRPWSGDEDRQLIQGYKKYKNEKTIWSMIKNKFFADSIRTNVNLKDRARTLGLK